MDASFMKSHLIQWLKIVTKNDDLKLDDLTDGVLLNQLMLNICPAFNCKPIHKNLGLDATMKKENLQIVLEQIKYFYKNELKSVIVMKLPDVMKMLQEPQSNETINEIEKMVVLILGCAVQCENREVFVESMKQLTYNGMEAMMTHIKMVHNDTKDLSHAVLSSNYEDYIGDEDALQSLLQHIIDLTEQRDSLHQVCTDMSMLNINENDDVVSVTSSKLSRRESSSKYYETINELSQAKSKIKTLQLQLNEQVDFNMEQKEKIEHIHQENKTMKKESDQLLIDAKSARSYRDENDILKNRVLKLQQLESEVDNWKEKLKDFQYYKKRVDDLRTDIRVLREQKSLVEEDLQLTTSQLKSVGEKDIKIAELRQELNNIRKEEEIDKNKIEELTELISQLQLDKTQSLNESGNLAVQLERALNNSASRPSIQEESTESLHAQILKLEGENRRLNEVNKAYLQSLKTNEVTQANMVELEKENKRLIKKLKKNQESSTKQKIQSVKQEELVKNLQAETIQLQSAIQVNKSNNARKIEELEEEKREVDNQLKIIMSNKYEGGENMKNLQKQNKVFLELNKDLNNKLRKMDSELKQVTDLHNESKIKVSTADKIHKENKKLEKENIQLIKKVKHLEIVCQNVEDIEQNNTDLTIENRQLKEQTKNLKQLNTQLETLEDNKSTNEHQLARYKRQNEALKEQLQSFIELEEQNKHKDKRINNLTNKLKYHEKLQITQMELETEIERVRTNLNKNKSLLSKKENEYFELEINYNDLNKELNQTKIKINKLESSEIMNSELEKEIVNIKSASKKLAMELHQSKDQMLLSDQKLELMKVEMEKLKSLNKELLGDYDLNPPVQKSLTTNINSSSYSKNILIENSPAACETEKNQSEKLLSSSSSPKKINEVKLIRDYNSIKNDYMELLDRHQHLLNNENKNIGEGNKQIIKLQDRLVNTERKNATLEIEMKNLNELNKNCIKNNQEIQSKLVLAEKKNVLHNDKIQAIQKQWSLTQAENGSLNEQCSNLKSKVNEHTLQFSKVQIEKEKLKIENDNIGKKLEEAIKDYNVVKTCYERQTFELEEVTNKNKDLKNQVKSFKYKINELLKENDKNMNLSLSEGNDSKNLEAITNAHEKLNKSYNKLNSDYNETQEEISKTKSVNNKLKIQLAKLSAETSQIKGHNQQLDITSAKLKNKCQVLEQLKHNLEDENEHLVEQVSRLMQQNEELLLQMLESKDQIYNEQKQYTERMQEVRRQKEKLEEKIMDIYRSPNNNTSNSKRKQGLGATIKKTFANFASTSNKNGDKKKLTSSLHSNNSSSLSRSQNESAVLENKDSTSNDSGSQQGWIFNHDVQFESISGRNTPLNHHFPAEQNFSSINNENNLTQNNHHLLRLNQLSRNNNNRNNTLPDNHPISNHNNNNFTPINHDLFSHLVSPIHKPPDDASMATAFGVQHKVARIDVPPNSDNAVKIPPPYDRHIAMKRHDVPPPSVMTSLSQSSAVGSSVARKDVPPNNQPKQQQHQLLRHNNSQQQQKDEDDLWYEYGCL